MKAKGTNTQRHSTLILGPHSTLKGELSLIIRGEGNGDREKNMALGVIKSGCSKFHATTLNTILYTGLKIYP